MLNKLAYNLEGVKAQTFPDVTVTLGEDANAFFPEQVKVSIPGNDLSDIIGAYPKG